MSDSYFIGIDVGTQGARVVLVDADGNIVAAREEGFPLNDQSREEQDPSIWWEACRRSLKSLTDEASRLIFLPAIKSIAVTSTSGTVIPLDEKREPLHHAIMYSDKRSAAEGKLCREMALQFHNDGYTGFNSSSGLSKILWYVRRFPEKAGRVTKWIHASDYVTGRLTGSWGITDYTNALKSGFDLKRKEWPSYLFDRLGLRKEWFPEVVPSGTPLGRISPGVAA
ncbi:MAG TPA: FGGY family carbohydrate kinase, partial [Chryseosolibacter sp.]